MDYGYFQYEQPYSRVRQRRINYFAWTVAILLLTGAAFAAWLLSFYIFGQPERPDSYHVLQKLHKVDPPKRFELTAAPAGEFLTAKQLYDRYINMGSAVLARTNSELARNYIRNFQQVRGLVPYLVGRYVVMDARELGASDIFTSGMVALTSAVDNGELLMEHVYPADPQALPLMKQTLTPGLEIKLERTHDLSAVIHAERLGDGRIMITAVPLLYGTYTITHGTGTFSLDPPLTLNLEAGWPLFKEQGRLKAEMHFAQYRRGAAGPQGPIPIAGLNPSGTPPPPQNALVRVEAAKPVEPIAVAQATPKNVAATKPTPLSKHGKLAKNQRPSATPASSAAPVQAPVVAQQPPPTAAAPPSAAAQTPSSASSVASKVPTAVAAASPAAAAPAAPASASAPAQPAAADSSGNALASTAGGGNWKTFAPGRMPLGRLIAPSDLNDLAERGMVGERVYLKGQFVVNFSDANRAVLRPRTRLASAMLHLGGSSTRIIVEFPAGYTPPAQGTVVSRDEARPFEITEVRKQEDGQLNVFAREIMQ
jgi:hypothetical protein